MLAKRVRRLETEVSPEYKYRDIDFTQSGVSVDATGIVTNLTAIAQGDGSFDRDGSQVTVRSVQCKGQLRLNPSATATEFRIIIFIRPRNGLLVTNPSYLLNPVRTTALKNIDNRRNLVILYDKTINVNTDRPCASFSFYKKLNVRTLFGQTQTGSTFNQIEDNAIGALILSDEPTNWPALYIYYRTCYTDN